MNLNLISKIFLIRLLAIIGCLFSIYGQSKIIYVSMDGSDQNSGLTIESSLNDISTAIKKASAGDTIYILPGSYKGIIIFNGKSGLPDKPIYLCGVPDNRGNYPQIDGGLETPSNDAQDDWMRITNSSWITVSNLKFINGWTYPIKVENSSYLTFRQCEFYGGRRVINAEGIHTHHILVEGCVWDQGGNFLWKAEKDSLGVDAWLSMHHMSMGYFNGSLIDFHKTGGSIVIRDNIITNAYNAIRFRGEKGYDANIEIYGNDISNIRDNDFEPEYYTYNLHIYHNRSHNVHKTFSVDNVEGGLILYYGNVVTSDSDSWTVKICNGIWKLYGTERKLSYPLYAFNNSFYTFGTAFLNMHGKAMYLKHYNNAYYFKTDYAWDLNEWDSSDEFDYDISNKPFPKNLFNHRQEMHGKICDIKFKDPSKEKLKLQPGSAGIDAGKIISLKEFNWIQSFEGKAPDIGAYENNKLVEGPPFRYLVPPGSKINLKEKPRIVRNYIKGNKIVIYFSDKIDASSVRKEFISIYKGGKKMKIASVSFPENEYQMVIEAGMLLGEGEFSISFNQMPKGINGEAATFWASTIRKH